MANDDSHWMNLALRLAGRGRGFVEPNPMVGCVIVADGEMIGSGYHERFGGPHAEVNAVANCSPELLKGSTIYVTLEPCSHFGKTPPCVDTLLRYRPKRLVIAMQDPFPEVAGRGIQKLRENGIETTVGIEEEKARELNAPYFKLLETGLPWVIAKWAMTLDGAIATCGGDSQWISNPESRQRVHQIRSRIDAIVVGSGTVIADDPLLTTRMANGEAANRIATRVVIDRRLQIPLQSKLVQSISPLCPLLVATSRESNPHHLRELNEAGCEILLIPEERLSTSLRFVLEELGKRRITNVLLEGGGTILGHAFDQRLVDQVHCFIATKIVGGATARRPVAGKGVEWMREAMLLRSTTIETLDGDVHVIGFR